MSDFHKAYLCGWGSVDYKKFKHRPSDKPGIWTPDVSFLCPNQAHLDLLRSILKEWGASDAGIKISKGQQYGGHSICMLNLATAGVPELTRRVGESFQEAARHNPIAFLRGKS